MSKNAKKIIVQKRTENSTKSNQRVNKRTKCSGSRDNKKTGPHHERSNSKSNNCGAKKKNAPVTSSSSTSQMLSMITSQDNETQDEDDTIEIPCHEHQHFLGSLDLKPVSRKAGSPDSSIKVDVCPLKSQEEDHASDFAKEEEANADRIRTAMSDHNMKPELVPQMTISKTKINSCESRDSSQKDKECVSKSSKEIEKSKDKNYDSCIGNTPRTLAHEAAEEKIIQKVQQIEQSYNKHKMNYPKNSDNSHQKEESTVIIFRDNNKKMKINSDGTTHDENRPDSLFDSLDANRNGRKRRYAKLMKKLEDTEKSLETNLKGIMESEKEDKSDHIFVTACMDKVKKKLCVRAKKKYESLINYQRIKANDEQKSFEDLLPEKADLVKSNIVKELVGDKAEGIRVRKPRGRPRKIPAIVNTPSKEKEKNSGTSKKTKSNNSHVVRGFPRKFPRSLLQDSNSSNVLKADKIRLGIIDKNGTKEVIELSNETLRVSNLNKVDSNHPELYQSKHFPCDNQEARKIRPNDSENQSLEGHALKLRGQGDCTYSSDSNENKNQKSLNSALGSDSLGESWLTSPPTTIRLPTISSLESDYQIVSLSSSHPKKIGDFRKDQFFIPQSTFSKDGKKGMVIVGPFCVSYTPKPHLILVPPKDHQKKEPMILKRKLGAPFKSAKGCASGAGCEGEFSLSMEDSEESPCGDHNYCIPLSLQDAARKSAKGMSKHDSITRFIDARVESIQEGQGNSVVTIKGDNILKQVKNLPQQASVPISTTKDGIPVVYNLTQITTPVLRRAEERARRKEMAEDSQCSGDFTPVYIPLEAMGDVVMEVLIPPCGTEIIPRAKVKQTKGTEVLNTNLSICPSNQNQSFRVIGSMPGKPLSTLLPPSRSGDEVSFLNNASGNVIVIDADLHSSSLPQGEKMEIFNKEEDEHGCQEVVPIENEASLEGSPGLGCCRLCLRLFPTAYALFSHVRSIHASGVAEDAVYLEELKARSKLNCPMCRPPVYFSTPLKLERHLQIYHSLDHLKEVCSYCFMEFSDIQELVIHLQLSHGIYTVDNSACVLPRASKMKSHHGHMNYLKCKRSLLSDYLTCSRCNIMFDDRNSLVSHTLTVHPDLNQGNVCRLCEREFDTDTALRKHLRNSHEQTQSGALRCPYCPAWLASMDEASMHKVTVHSGAVPVHCPFCGAGYQSVHPMYNHVRTQHLLTESHVCPECQASFPTTRLLTDHARREHLISARVIKDHIRSVRSASYCCPFCTISFTRTYDLAVHVVMNHKDPLLPAKCHFCMQAFVNPIIMKMHMAAAHAVHLDQQEDEREDLSFLPEGMEGDDSVTVVLEAGEDDGYSGPSSFSMPGKNLGYDMSDMRHHLLMDPRDVLETQEAVSYIQNLDDRDNETIVYLNDRNQVMSIPVGHDVPAGDMFDTCSRMSEGRLLDESLQAVDYLETLSNDRIAVAADVVADVIMDDIVAGERRMSGGRVVQVDDMLGLNGQFEVDGVLYEFAAAQEDRPMDLQGDDDQITLDSNELGHFLSQQVH